MKNLFLIFLFTVGMADCFAQPAASKDITRDSYITFKTVEYEPRFPGGLPGWQQYLTQHIKFDRIMPIVPKTGKRWEETAVVEFIVEKDGAIQEIKVLNAVSEPVAKEAIRIIAVSPRWEPAMQNGKKVRAYKTQPISFVVEPM